MIGKLVILSGPSGVGKDTVISEWAKVDPQVSRVVAYATRAPRDVEVDGVDYHFVSLAEFQAKAVAGDFLEYKEVHGNYYATPLRDMEALLSGGKLAVLKIDVQGALSVMELRPEAVSVFLMAPSDEELEARIRGRGTESEVAILKRLANARAEVGLAMHYRYQVVNDDVSAVVRKLQEVTA